MERNLSVSYHDLGLNFIFFKFYVFYNTTKPTEISLGTLGKIRGGGGNVKKMSYNPRIYDDVNSRQRYKKKLI